MARIEPEIEARRNERGGFDRQAIREILPYGDDFLFVDEVLELTPTEIEAVYTIPADSAYIRSHFRDQPIMPGVLVGEGMAQAGTLLVRYNLEHHRDKHLLAYQIDTARFTRPAQPGDRLLYRVRLLNLRAQAARLEGETLVDGRSICKARIALGIIDRESLRAQLEAQRPS